ncbi:MAG: serine hydrolase, partial [Gemmatimonadota bacterium]|nr:serine hydrolase [Gemmatimonadota bacterium]
MSDRTRLRGGLRDRLLLGVGLAITLGAGACRDVAEDRSDGKLAGLSDYIRSSLTDWELPGLAVAVVHGDEMIFAEGFGVKEVGREDPVDAHTLFQIGSVYKSFGAAAIGALVDNGLVEWDDPVVEHLTWFRVKDPGITREMTIRDLLSHQSGMPGDAFPTLAIMDARAAAERVRHLDNQTPLRESFRYSNQGYGVAGLVAEAVTGKTWGDWVRESLLDPLEMHSSAASPYEVWEDPFVAPTFLGTAPAGTVGIGDAPGRNVAMPHGLDRQGTRRVLVWQSYDSMQAAGSMVSSAAEMANWLRMHLARGRFGDRTVLGAATVDEMHSPQ